MNTFRIPGHPGGTAWPGQSQPFCLNCPGLHIPYCTLHRWQSLWETRRSLTMETAQVFCKNTTEQGHECLKTNVQTSVLPSHHLVNIYITHGSWRPVKSKKYPSFFKAKFSETARRFQNVSSSQKWFLRPYFPLIRGMFLFRSGLRFSFRALEVPEQRVRKRPLSLTKCLKRTSKTTSQ